MTKRKDKKRMVFLTLSECQRLYGLDPDLLTRMVNHDNMEHITNKLGEIMISERNAQQLKKHFESPTKSEVIQKKWPDLDNKPITISQAAKKYNVPRTTIHCWVKDYNYIEIINDKHPLEINESDVAYFVDIYNRRKRTKKGRRGAPLIDSTGREYQLKRPNLSEYRAKKAK